MVVVLAIQLIHLVRTGLVHRVLEQLRPLLQDVERVEVGVAHVGGGDGEGRIQDLVDAVLPIQ